MANFFKLESFWQDVRFGARMFRKNPAFTAIAVLTLALGIGANTAVFSVVNAVLLQPLPYPDSQRIVNISRKDGANLSMPMFAFWQANQSSFEDVAGYDTSATGVNFNEGNRADVVLGLHASRNYFRLFGAMPILGRTFNELEDSPGGPNVLLLSYELWQTRFGGDAGVVGKQVSLGGGSYTIVGVISPSFKPEPAADVWMPLQVDPNSRSQAHLYTGTARLREGVSLAQANAEMAVIGKRYAQMHPEQLGHDDLLQVQPLQTRLIGELRPLLLILLGAVGLVLLIACANVANLLLARATGRQREIAVRVALGAGRGRIARQLLTESLLLALAAGALGLLVGSWGTRGLLALTPGNLPRAGEISAIPALNPWVAGFTLLISIVTAIFFSLFPAAQMGRVDLAMQLGESGGRAGSGAKQSRTRSILVAAEVAVALMLVCGAMLLMRSFAALHRVNPGFDAHNVLMMKVALAGPAYEKAAVVNGIAEQATTRLEEIPGVASAAMCSSVPLEPSMDMVFDIPGRAPLKGYRFTGDVLWVFASAHYFQTLRIPLVTGRLLGDQEPKSTVVINEAFARKFWPGENPLGKTILIGAQLGPALEQGPTEIVGVVGDVHDRLEWAAPPTMYQLQSQVSDAGMKLVNQQMLSDVIVRTRAGIAPMGLSEETQQALLASGIELPATHMQTMEQLSLRSTARQNFSLVMLGIFAAMALLLTAVGIYGVMSQSVAQRTREIGIRAALGASRADIFRLVLRQASWVTVCGLAIGIAGAYAGTRLLKSELFGVTATDPLTFAAVPVFLFLVALAAAWIPARRAMRVDPMAALRYE